MLDAPDVSARPADATSLAVAVPDYAGPLDVLLERVRAHAIDLAGLPLPALIDQLVAAIEGSPAPIAARADWLRLGAQLVWLRSRLLLPGAADAPDPAALAEAAVLRGALLARAEIAAAAAWLDRRPQLGRDVWARGAPAEEGAVEAAVWDVDPVDLLWGLMACLEVAPEAVGLATAPARARRPELPSAEAVRAHILEVVGAGQGTAVPLAACVPPLPGTEGEHRRWLVRAGVARTFVGGLELAREGRVRIEQVQSEVMLANKMRPL